MAGKIAICIACAALLVALPMGGLQIADMAMSGGHLGDVQKNLWNFWYSFVLYMAPLDEFSVMNWGLAPPLHDCSNNTSESHQANLYLELASLAEFKGSVLEIGSGRGGGASILARCKCPKEYIGLDLQAGQVAAAQQRFGQDGSCPLSFVEGDAENLQMSNNSIDVVLSVETSHTYPHFQQFVKEVHRVLRPGGTFHITDFRDPGDQEAMIRDISLVFGEPVSFKDISSRVAKALEKDTGVEGSRRKLVSRLCPSFMLSACLQFIGTDAMTRLNAKTKFYIMALFKKSSD